MSIIKEKQIIDSLKAPYILPVERAGDYSPPLDTLFDSGESCNEIELEKLLVLEDVNKQNITWGYTLRPYWVPDTILSYRSSTLSEDSSGTTYSAEACIKRSMLKCEAFHYVWDETIAQSARFRDILVPQDKKVRCYYDQIDQTLRQTTLNSSSSPLSVDMEILPKGVVKARLLAISNLSFLFPIGPMQIGHSWEGRAGKNFMKYTLCKNECVSGMDVLIIKREGYITIHVKASMTGNYSTKALDMIVKGCTAFAFNRGIILEDRVILCTKNKDDLLAQKTAIKKVRGITRLIQSSPDSHRDSNHCQGAKHKFKERR